MKIEGIEVVKKQLQDRLSKAEKDKDSAVVGYTASYALIVHEDLDAKHKEGKQAKYLEGLARRYKRQIAEVVRDGYKKTGSMAQALLLGAFRLLRESQQVVPVDTSALKASGFASLDSESNAAARRAFQASEARRDKVKKKRNK